MCLGIGTTTTSTDASGTAITAGTHDKNNQTGVVGGMFCHNSYANIYTNSAAKTNADFTAKSVAAVTSVATVKTQGGIAALTPTGCTTMNGVKTYGTITTPAATWYDDAATDSTGAAGYFSHSDVPIASTTTAVSAIFMMPVEADTYADVPRLSPLDTSGWKGYAPDVGTAAGFGKMNAQLTVANSTIIDSFATTVAAGVAVVGAAALSF